MNHLDKQTRLALRLRSLSLKRWGPEGEVTLLGRHKSFREAQKRLLQFSLVDRPILIHGESGVGKEMFARSLYLLSERRAGPFLSVNCAQFQSEDLLVSELFGHTAGAFTGATSDRVGLFERAEGGVVFLDEVGELTQKAQAMLLRTLGEGEVMRLGESTPQYVDVRVVAATNRNLREEVEAGRFRSDLFYRLCYLHLHLPPLRERGEDWKIIIEDYLDDLNYEHGFTDAASQRLLTEPALDLLGAYPWPGNVRELQAVADVGFCLAPGAEIDVEHVAERLHAAPKLNGASPAMAATSTAVSGSGPGDGGARIGQGAPSGTLSRTDDDPLARYYAMESGESTFWEAIRAPYLDRDLNRVEVRIVVARGLSATGGSYKKLLPLFGIDEDDYLKFMDFLRHHRLKPPQPW
jgi:two-component system nitrogen regulation response regulator NtrX